MLQEHRMIENSIRKYEYLRMKMRVRKLQWRIEMKRHKEVIEGTISYISLVFIDIS